MTPEDDPSASVVEALGHLQTAFLELIAAARVSLDAIEKAVRAVPPPAPPAPSEPGPEGDHSRVEHIRVS